MSLRIGTFNILSTASASYANGSCKPGREDEGLAKDEIERYGRITWLLADSDLDVIFLQEVFFTFPPIANAQQNFVDRYHFVYHNDSIRGGFLAILLKKAQFDAPSVSVSFPNMNKYMYGYPATQLPTRLQYITAKDKSGKSYNLVNMHLPNNPTDLEGTESIRRDSYAVFNKITQDPNPTIIAGDSNIVIRKETLYDINDAHHLTAVDNIEGYSSYSDVVCIREDSGAVTSSYSIKSDKYEFIDRIYVRGLRQKTPQKIVPYSSYYYDPSTGIIALTNDYPFDRLSPGGFPYCIPTQKHEERVMCKKDRYATIITEHDWYQWPSDHAMLIVDLIPVMSVAIKEFVPGMSATAQEFVPGMSVTAQEFAPRVGAAPQKSTPDERTRQIAEIESRYDRLLNANNDAQVKLMTKKRQIEDTHEDAVITEELQVLAEGRLDLKKQKTQELRDLE